MRYVELNRESIEQALSEWSPRQAGAGVVALLPEAEKDRLPVLQAACRQYGLGLVGAIFPALIRQEVFLSQGAWLLRFDQMPPRFLLPAVNATGDAAGAVVAAAREGLQHCSAEAPKPTLFMFFDGMVPNVASILDDIYLELSNRVEYGGVNAGSETFQPMPCLFDETQVVGDGVLGLLLPGNMAPTLEHGFQQPEHAMSATSTEGNRIAMIDWRPAFDVYQEIIKAQYGIDLRRDNFYEYAVHFPFGILRANGEVVVRIPVALTDDGSLYCVGEIPENAMLVLLQAPAAGAHGCIARLADHLCGAHGAMRGTQLLTFYCAGRRMHLGADAEKELIALRDETAVGEMGGALSLGEIGSTVRWGYPMFHNATLVCSPWPMT
ncbi:MAG: histidine kinase [Azonexaceae bacterium]|nr:histidine kinase [Azonexaceae bacterium]